MLQNQQAAPRILSFPALYEDETVGKLPDGLTESLGQVIATYAYLTGQDAMLRCTRFLLNNIEAALVIKGQHKQYRPIIDELNAQWREAHRYRNTPTVETICGDIERYLTIIAYKERLLKLREDMFTQLYPDARMSKAGEGGL
jgi:hypothetical protein